MRSWRAVTIDSKSNRFFRTEVGPGFKKNSTTLSAIFAKSVMKSLNTFVKSEHRQKKFKATLRNTLLKETTKFQKQIIGGVLSAKIPVELSSVLKNPTFAHLIELEDSNT